MTICLVDTSVFCEILGVPSMCSDHATVVGEFKKRHKAGESFLLPMATILETGNHIGQNGDGRQRRATAQRFVKMVVAAIDGEAPFTPAPFVDLPELRIWLEGFAETAGRGVGLGDLSIIEEWNRQKERHPARRVYIWSKDRDLTGYDSTPS